MAVASGGGDASQWSRMQKKKQLTRGGGDGCCMRWR